MQEGVSCFFILINIVSHRTTGISIFKIIQEIEKNKMFKDCPACGKKGMDESGLCRECGSSLQSLSAENTKLLNNRFEISSVVSSSAERMLYRAVDITHNSVVAVKAFLASCLDLSDLQNIKERFAEEERFSALVHCLTELNHHGLPRIIDSFTGNDPLSGKEANFIVMTFIEGKSLEEIMKERTDKPLPLDKASEYLRQILEILKYLHSRTPSFVHGDVSAKNILIDEGRVFLTGYRIADFSASGQKDRVLPLMQVSESADSPDNTEIDLFSLGAVMCYLLTGKHPTEDIERAFLSKALRKINTEVPAYMEQIVSSILDSRSEKRLTSASRALDILREGIKRDAELMSLQTLQQNQQSLKEEKVDEKADSQGKKRSDAALSGSGTLSGPDHRKDKIADNKDLPSETEKAKKARVLREMPTLDKSAAVFAHQVNEPVLSSYPGARFPSEKEEKKHEKIVINFLEVAEFNNWLGKHMEAKFLFPSKSENVEGVYESSDQYRTEMEKLSLMTSQEKDAKIELINSLLDTFEPIRQKDED